MKKLFKKLKGFTLIELLAVIVILAVISLIAVPIVLNIINDSRRSAAIESARGYIKAVNFKIAEEELKDNIITDGDYVIGNNALAVTVKNSENIIGMYSIQDNYVIWAGLCVNHFPIEYNAITGKTMISNDDYCEGEFPHIFVEPEAEFVRTICESDDADSVYNDNEKFKVKTVEDFVCLSTQVNSGKNFIDKEIYLLSDIDFNSDDSYKDKNTTDYGDINGNGTIEGLKDEVTTGKGFKQIGTESNGFKGTFTGYAFTINNLMINRPDETYVGLFGHLLGSTDGTDGIIQGVRITNANVAGKGYVGTLVGVSSSGKIKNVDIKGNVSSVNVDCTGGVVGYNGYIRNNGWSYYSHLTDFIYSGTVQGHNLLGGVTGSNAYAQNTISGVVYDTTVRITTSNSQVGKVSTGATPGGTVMVSANTTISPNNTSYYNGTLYNDDDMATYDRAIDTVIGGDSNGDGYYFDYDENYNLRLYSVDRAPAKTKLKGAGTEASPYLISSVNDWKRAATSLDDEPKYYALTKDLDFSGEKFYSMGTNANHFKGVFLGNHHTIKNVTISGYDNVGVFGYNDVGAVVKDLKFDNINITALGTNAGIFAVNDGGKINGIIGRNITVHAQGAVGGLVGYNTAGNSNTDSVIKNVDIQATVSSVNVDNAGGLIGNNAYKYINGWQIHSEVSDFVVKATVSGHNLLGGAFGSNAIAANIANGVVYDTSVTITSTNSTIGKASTGNTPTGTILVSNTTTISPTANYNNGLIYNTPSMSVFDKAVDTIIGGDNDGDGYYFDFDSNGVLTLYSTTERPIPTVRGAGTEASPYLISSVSDWNAAVATIDGEPHYYSLTADLDFTNKTFYTMGTQKNPFKGVFMGNHHTLSNVTTTGYDYVGIFGYNTVGSTIKDINFNNISITAQSSRAGLVAENDGGKINGVKGRNINVTAAGIVGGLVGHNTAGSNNNDSVIKNIDIQGHITSINVDHTGGIIGQNDYKYINGWRIRTTVNDFVFKGTVEGHNLLGGAFGSNAVGDNIANGVVYDTSVTITSTNSTIGKASTGNTPSGTIMTSASTTTSPSGSGNNGTNFTDITLDSVNGVIDTTIGGDNDGDGYYFTLTNGEYELITAN